MIPTAEDGDKHDCIAETSQQYSPRPDLIDHPLKTGDVVFVDGSAKKDDKGTNRVGYAVVTENKILKAERLPGNYSAQAAELVALTEACKLYKGKKVTIYTDSQYAFATLHVFCKQWQQRGMKTSTGNTFADISAKAAAMKTLEQIDTHFSADATVLHDMQHAATFQEKQGWLKKGAKLVDDIYT